MYGTSLFFADIEHSPRPQVGQLYEETLATGTGTTLVIGLCFLPVYLTLPEPYQTLIFLSPFEP